MKLRFWSLFLTLSLYCVPILALVPTFVPRSQSVNVAREMVGWQEFINLPCADSYYNAFTITPEYMHSYQAGELTECLFGDDATTTLCNQNFIHISGSHVPERSETDWLADYFGLSPDFESSLFLQPTIKNFLVDFNFYQGLDPFIRGMYVKIHAPFVHTHWNLKAYELVEQRGVEGYIPGYFNDLGAPRDQLLNNATEFLSGLKSISFNDVATPVSQCKRNIRAQKLQCSKIPTDGCHGKALTRNGLSDIECALGWNFIRNEDYLVGLSVRASAPLGNVPNDEFFFAPIIGDGKHWKAGLALNGQLILWRNECEDASVGVFLDARAQHLFSTCQTRCFDLCAKPNSRYMLAQRLGSYRLPIHIIDEAASHFEFQNEFAPVANLTRTNVDVRILVEGDSALKIAYMGPQWSFDLGYNYWGRSCERICRMIRNNNPHPLDDNAWALKGDAHVIGFINDATTTCVSLSAVETNADIHGGTNNFPGGINNVRPSANPGITNPIELTAANAGNQIDDLPAAATGIPTRSSNPVIFLTPQHINFSGTKGLSEKLFIHASYYWERCETIALFIGIGGELEMAHKTDDEGCSTRCPSPTSVPSTDCSKTLGNNCQRCTLSQWGIWVKGGVAFN